MCAERSTYAYLSPYLQAPHNWDRSLSNKLMDYNDEHTLVTNMCSHPRFKTVLGSEPFVQGQVHYFEIKILKGKHFKIGVSTKNCKFDAAFSDFAEGWAYYSSGSLRNNSPSKGPSYGKTFKEGDTVGVILDLIEGKIIFSKNEEIFPVAFENPELLKLELYPACAAIVKGDCFEFIQPQPED